MKTASQVSRLQFRLPYVWVAFKKTALKSVVWLKFTWDVFFCEADAQDAGKEWALNGCFSLTCHFIFPQKLSPQILEKVLADRNVCDFIMISDGVSSAARTQRKTLEHTQKRGPTTTWARRVKTPTKVLMQPPHLPGISDEFTVGLSGLA